MERQKWIVICKSWVQASYSLASPHTASLVCDETFAFLEFPWIKGMLKT